MTPKVSICIPAYNHQKYISFTIESILKQSFQDFEIIISDDNSTDDTVKIAEGFQDKRIKIIKNNHNSGPSVNCNKAISVATGDFIAFIASDDVMEASRLEKSLDFFKLNPQHGAVFSFVQTIDKDGNEIDHHSMRLFNVDCGERVEIINRFFYRGNFLCAPSCMMRSSVIKKIGAFNPCLLQLQDFDLWIRLAIAGYEIGTIKEKLTFYRVNEGSLSGIGGKMNNKILSCEYFEMTKILENFLEISSVKDFVKIFPDHKNIPENLSKEYFAFFIAIESLEVSKKLFIKNEISVYGNIYKSFAINIFYSFLKKNVQDKIILDYGFKINDFFNLIKSNSIVEAAYISLVQSGFKRRSRLDKLKISFKKISYKIKKLFHN